MKKPFLVVVDEEFVRDVQIATTPEADHVGKTWIDVVGDFSLGIYDAESKQQAIEFAAQINSVHHELLTAYAIDSSNQL